MVTASPSRPFARWLVARLRRRRRAWIVLRLAGRALRAGVKPGCGRPCLLRFAAQPGASREARPALAKDTTLSGEPGAPAALAPDTPTPPQPRNQPVWPPRHRHEGPNPRQSRLRRRRQPGSPPAARAAAHRALVSRHGRRALLRAGVERRASRARDRGHRAGEHRLRRRRERGRMDGIGARVVPERADPRLRARARHRRGACAALPCRAAGGRKHVRPRRRGRSDPGHVLPVVLGGLGRE